MIEKLKEKLGSFTKALDVLYVMEGVKQCSRIMVKEEDYNEIKGFLGKLHVDKANFKVLKLDKGSFSNKGEKINIKDKRKGYYFVYVSKDKNIVKKAKEFEENDDHVNLGLTLGYPKCCCSFFSDNVIMQERRFNDYILPALKLSKGFVFPFYNNFAARYFDLSLLSHFPCNFDCKKSLAIAKKNLRVVEKYSKEYSAIVRGMLKGAVFYTENYGVFLLRGSVISNNEVRYSTIIGDRSNKLSELLKANNKINVVDKNHIKIGNQNLKTENLGVMFFY